MEDITYFVQSFPNCCHSCHPSKGGAFRHKGILNKITLA